MTEILTAERALELLDAAVADRGPNHRYPRAKVGVNDKGEFARYYGGNGPRLHQLEIDGTDPDDMHDYAEAVACHYFATKRDAALVKGIEEGAPMCIVGWVLDALGVSERDLLDVLGDRGNIEKPADAAIQAGKLTGKYELPPFGPERKRLLDLLMIVQGHQDGGSTWGQAVEVARKQIDQEP